MSGNFNLSDYVDVNERIQQFYAKYPEGGLTSELRPVTDETGALIGWLCEALAWRHPDDKIPARGHAFEPVPGKTPYTKDSEAMNAETSAWGRAIVALGFATKHLASANEVQARTGAEQAMQQARDLAANRTDSFAPEFTFGKHKGKRVDEVPRPYLEWLLENFEAKTDDQQLVLDAARAQLQPATVGGGAYPDDDSIPF